jgi:hypothetical protein
MPQKRQKVIYDIPKVTGLINNLIVRKHQKRLVWDHAKCECKQDFIFFLYTDKNKVTVLSTKYKLSPSLG